MTLYGTMIRFKSLALKSMALSHTLDSEHILDIVMCSKKCMYGVYYLQKKDYIRDAHAT